MRGVPRFVSSDGYASNFGFEWNLHNKTQLDTGARLMQKPFLRCDLLRHVAELIGPPQLPISA